MKRKAKLENIKKQTSQEKKKNLTAIGFDFDGTIIDLEEEKGKAFGTLLHQYWETAVSKAAQYWLDTGGKSRKSKFDYFFKKKFARNLTDQEYRKIESEFSNRLKSKFYPQAKLIKGALPLLQFCRKNFAVTFIASGVPQKEINYLVSLKKVSHYFDHIYGTNKKFKSKEDHFQAIINQYHPKRLIFVGDGFEDMRVGKKYQALTIGVPSHQTKKKLIKAGAQYVLATDQIKRFLKTL